ncbi:hypothetical protein HMI56_002071 [Coelomomyces lativittatus]|nr:hypothetical protein HMI56_002071 [Coelomomyces lativittatus]
MKMDCFFTLVLVIFSFCFSSIYTHFEKDPFIHFRNHGSTHVMYQESNPYLSTLISDGKCLKIDDFSISNVDYFQMCKGEFHLKFSFNRIAKFSVFDCKDHSECKNFDIYFIEEFLHGVKKKEFLQGIEGKFIIHCNIKTINELKSRTQKFEQAFMLSVVKENPVIATDFTKDFEIVEGFNFFFPHNEWRTISKTNNRRNYALKQIIPEYSIVLSFNGKAYTFNQAPSALTKELFVDSPILKLKLFGHPQLHLMTCDVTLKSKSSGIPDERSFNLMQCKEGYCHQPFVSYFEYSRSSNFKSIQDFQNVESRLVILCKYEEHIVHEAPRAYEMKFDEEFYILPFPHESVPFIDKKNKEYQEKQHPEISEGHPYVFIYLFFG